MRDIGIFLLGSIFTIVIFAISFFFYLKYVSYNNQENTFKRLSDPKRNNQIQKTGGVIRPLSIDEREEINSPEYLAMRDLLDKTTGS